MDVSREDIDKLTAAINGMTGTIGRSMSNNETDREKAKRSLRKSLGEYSASAKRRAREFESAVFQTEDKLRMLTGSLRDTATNIRRMIGGVFGGAIIGLVLEKGNEMAKTFSEMNEIGQNFGGSMNKMFQAAAEAGLPLSDFAELVKKNGEAMAKMGTQDFFKFALGVRKVTEKQGMYGYSLDQLNDQIGEYMQTAAMYGTANLAQTKNSTAEFANLAANTSVLADVTKKSREEITKLANEAMRSALAIGGMSQIPLNMRKNVQDKMANVMAVFAAQQGEAGRIMTKMLGDTMGTGFSGITEMGKMVNEAGLGDLLSGMDELAAKVKNNSASQEDAYKYNNKFMDEIDANIEQLTMLAASGNSAASQLIEARSHMKKYEEKDIAQAKKEVTQRTALTNLFGSFNSALGRIIGSIQSGFYTGIKPFLTVLGSMADKAGGWSYFEEKAQAFGTWIGKFLANTLNENTVKQIGDFISKLFYGGQVVVGALGAVGKVAVAIAPGLATLAKGVGIMVNVVSDVAGVFGTVGDKIFGTGNKLQKAFSGVAAALTIMFGPKLLKTVVSRFIKGFMGNKALDRTIMARTVNIYGNNSGGPGGFDLGGGGEGSGPHGGKGSRIGRGWRAGQRAARSAGRGRVGQVMGGLKGLLRAGSGGLKAGLSHVQGHGRFAAVASLLGLGLAGMGLFGSSSASAETMDEDRHDSVARPAPLKVMRASMISDIKEREKYNKLLQNRAALRNEDQNDETKKRLDAIDEQLNNYNDRYGMTVNNPSDYDYASIHGRLPPGSQQTDFNPRIKAAAASVTKNKNSTGDNSSGWLTAASAGLDLASFIPGLNIPAGLLGAGLDWYRGDKIGAGLSLASAIPIMGEGASAAKLARIAGKVGKTARLSQSALGFGSIGMAALSGVPGIASLFDSKDQDNPQEPDDDYTDTSTEDHVEVLKKMMSENEQQSKMIVQLLAELNRNQQDTTRLLGKVLTTRP